MSKVTQSKPCPQEVCLSVLSACPICLLSLVCLSFVCFLSLFSVSVSCQCRAFRRLSLVSLSALSILVVCQAGADVEEATVMDFAPTATDSQGVV